MIEDRDGAGAAYALLSGPMPDDGVARRPMMPVSQKLNEGGIMSIVRLVSFVVLLAASAGASLAFAQTPAPAPAAPAAVAPAPPPSKPDPAGTATGGIGDVSAKTAGKPTVEELADFLAPNPRATNFAWGLRPGCPAMFLR